MPNHAPEESGIRPSRALKWGLSICTAVYVILFPFLFYMALLSSMVSDGPSTTSFMVGAIMFIMFWLPLSVPISIYLMWSRLFRNQPGKALIFAGLPFYTFGVILFICGILDALIRNRYPW